MQRRSLFGLLSSLALVGCGGPTDEPIDQHAWLTSAPEDFDRATWRTLPEGAVYPIESANRDQPKAMLASAAAVEVPAELASAMVGRDISPSPNEVLVLVRSVQLGDEENGYLVRRGPKGELYVVASARGSRRTRWRITERPLVVRLPSLPSQVYVRSSTHE